MLLAQRFAEMTYLRDRNYVLGQIQSANGELKDNASQLCMSLKNTLALTESILYHRDADRQGTTTGASATNTDTELTSSGAESRKSTSKGKGGDAAAKKKAQEEEM